MYAYWFVKTKGFSQQVCVCTDLGFSASHSWHFLEQILLCCGGYPVHCQIFSSVTGQMQATLSPPVVCPKTLPNASHGAHGPQLRTTGHRPSDKAGEAGDTAPPHLSVQHLTITCKQVASENSHPALHPLQERPLAKSRDDTHISPDLPLCTMGQQGHAQ